MFESFQQFAVELLRALLVDELAEQVRRGIVVLLLLRSMRRRKALLHRLFTKRRGKL
jgi:hypothetical protein